MSLRSGLHRLDNRLARGSRYRLHRLARLVPKRLFRSRPFGVEVVGHSDASHSLGVVTRSLCAMLHAAGIPHRLISIDDLGFQSGRSFIDAGTGRRIRPRFAFTIITAWPDHVNLRVISPAAFAGRHVIACWACEQSELTDGFVAGISMVDEIWAPSSFAASTFARSTPKPVRRIPMAIDRRPAGTVTGTRERFGIPDDRIAFLTIAGAGSSFQRKNPAGALQAFRRAFPPGQSEAVLVIKLLPIEHPTAQQRAATEEFLAHDAFGPDVIVIDRRLSDDEVTDLLDACDCFVSLHRAEGFGLGAAEAMSMGKPVIVTNWSGPADYLTPENSLPVPYRLVTITEHDEPHFVKGLEWAEPDLEVAAAHMRTVVEDGTRCASLGRRAAQDIAANLSIDVLGAMIDDRLRQLHDR